MSLRAHTSHEFDAELRQLKDRLLAMAGRCERMLTSAIRAVETSDTALADRVVMTDRDVNSDEMAVDEMVARILALRQPVGRDLRFVICATKVVTDLERIGDEAVNIAERAHELADETTELPPPAALLPDMAALAAGMLGEALEAFVEEDPQKARKVLADDDKVDEQYGTILDRCVAYMQKEPARVLSGWRVSCCAKYLERVADHATNVAEMVVYLVEGSDVRHEGKRRSSADG